MNTCALFVIQIFIKLGRGRKILGPNNHPFRFSSFFFKDSCNFFNITFNKA